MLAVQPNRGQRYTIDEYLQFEEKSEIRHEFYKGEIYAMAGGTVNHNLLIDNVKDRLKTELKGKSCRVFSENMKVDVLSDGYMPYPDVLVTCHPFDLRGDNLIIRQPRLLVEVLSKSTASYDRGFKWQKYRKLPSLWYYMLIDQYSTTVELYSRIEETNEWINTIYENREDTIVLSRLDAEMTVGAIYDDIELVPIADDIPADDRS